MTFELNRHSFTRFLPASIFLLAAAYLSFVKGVISRYADETELWLVISAKLVFLIVGLLCLPLGLLMGRLAFLPVSIHQTPAISFLFYLLAVLVRLFGYLAFQRVEKMTKNPRKAQDELLLQILHENKDTEFGKKMNFGSIHDRNQYRQQVKLTRYDDYREYIERIEKGENNLLTKEPVNRLCVSSGTTGNCKHLPCTKKGLDQMFKTFLPGMYQFANYTTQSVAPLKQLDISFVPKWRYSECGLPIGPISGTPGNKVPLIFSLGKATPPEAFAEMPEPAQLYLHFYYGLYDRDLSYVVTSFAGLLVNALDFLEKNWKLLANDIRRGELTNFQNSIPVDVYYEEVKRLKPNPERADEIEAAFASGSEGVVKRLWPRIELASAIITGSHSVFESRLQHYLGPQIMISSAFYGSSECFIGLTLSREHLEKRCYDFLVNSGFYEFIPEEQVQSEDPTTLFLDELEIGKRYEIVVTSVFGFCRYRLGDILKIVDFHNQQPVFEFCTRTGCILDLRGEKTSEDMMLKALRNTKWPENGQLVDYLTTDCSTMRNTCHNYNPKDGLYYVLFVEIDSVHRALQADEVDAFDSALCDVTYPYKSFRVKKAITEPEILTVPHGTFEEMKRFILDRNSAVSNQYKTPHYSSNAGILQFLYKKACEFKSEDK